jgi:hypothetical protein
LVDSRILSLFLLGSQCRHIMSLAMHACTHAATRHPLLQTHYYYLPEVDDVMQFIEGQRPKPKPPGHEDDEEVCAAW